MTASPSASQQRDLDGEVEAFAGGAVTAVAGRVGGRLVQLIVQVVLARTLGPVQFGLYALGWAVFRVGNLVGPLGLDNGVVHFGAAARVSGTGAFHTVVRRCLLLALTGGGLVGLAVWVTAPVLSARVFRQPELLDVLVLLAPAFLFASFLRVGAFATRVSERMVAGALTDDFGQPAIQLLLVALFSVLLPGLSGALWAATLSFALAAGLVVVALRVSFPTEPRVASARAPTVRQLFSYSLPTALTSFFGMLVVWVDRLFVGYYLPLEDLGVYQVVSQFALVFAVILSGFNQMFSPMIARWYHAGDMESAREMYRVSTKWTLYISLPLFLMIVLAPDSLLGLMFGDPYRVGATALIVLGAGQLFNAATGSVVRALVMTRLERSAYRLSIFAFFVNCVACMVLVPSYGVTGAAAATVASIVVLFGGGLIVVGRAHGLWPYDRRYLKGAAAASIAAAMGAALRVTIPGSEALLVGMLIVLVPASFFGVLWALGVDPEDRVVFAAIRRRLGMRMGGSV